MNEPVQSRRVDSVSGPVTAWRDSLREWTTTQALVSVLNRLVRDLARMDRTAPQPSAPSDHKNDGWMAGVCQGRYFDRPRPTSTVPGRHRAATVYS